MMVTESVWVARYWHGGTRYDHECDSAEEAILYFAQGEEDGTLAYEALLRPDGTVALNDEEIFKVTYAYVMNGQMQQPDWRQLLADLLKGACPR